MGKKEDKKPLLKIDKSLEKVNLKEETYGAVKNGHVKIVDGKDAKKKKPSQQPVSVRKLYRYATPLDYVLMFVGSLVAIVSGSGWPLMSTIFGGLSNTMVSAQASPWVTGHNISDFNFTEENVLAISKEQFLAETQTYCLQYTYFGFAIMLAGYIQVTCWITTGERQIHKIRQEFFRAIMRQEIKWFDENASGTLTTKLSDNLERVKEGIGDKFSLLLQYTAQVIVGFIVAFVYSWQLTLVMLALTPFMAGGAWMMSKLIGQAVRREAEKYAKAGAIAEEVLGNIKTVISFNGQKRESKRYEMALADGKADGVKKGLFTGLGLSVTFIVMFSMYSLAFWYGSILINEGIIDRGTVFVVLMSVMMGSFAIGNAGPQLATLAGAKGAAASIFEVIDQKPQIDAYSNSGKKLSNVKGSIAFKGVDFAYPSRPEIEILKNVTFEVKPGEKIALVGSSGCGKSTVVNLLLRYYNANGGQILFDGVPLQELNVRWLRKTIGVVSQEPILFETSVEENIRYGRQHITHEQLIQATRQANAHQFITGLPDGYNTLVGERGAQLSGGQKQRIAIARALVRDPKVLLLDEATSALDAESEGIVQEALDKAQQGRTTFIIAHRLSTIRNADKIIGMKDGEIKEIGTHNELMASKGLYYELVTAQMFDNAAGSGYASAADALTSQTDANNDSLEDNELISPIEVPKKIRRHSSKQRSSGRRSKGGLISDGNESDDSASSGVSSSIGSTLKRKSRRSKQQPLTGPKKNKSAMEKLKEDLAEEGAEKSDFKTILRWSKPDWLWMTVGFVASALRGLIMPSFAFFYSELFNTYSKTGEELIAGTRFWAIMLVALGFANGLTTLISSYFFGLSGENITMRMRMAVFDNLLRQDAGYFDLPSHSTGKICTRLATDAPNIRAAVDFRLGNVLQALLSLVCGVGLAFVFGWKMALVVTAVFPLVVLGGTIRMRMKVSSSQRDAKLLEEAGKVASEAIENIRTVQALTRENTFYEQFHRLLLLPYKEALKQAHIQAISYGFSSAIFFFMYAICFRFGAYLIEIGDMDPLGVYRVFFSINFSSMAVGFAATYFPEYMKAKFSAGLILKMASTKPKIDSMGEGGLKPKVKGAIEFRDVQFRYPTRPDAPVLSGTNLIVDPGTTVALVGPSGCGKSTTVSLLLRFYDPLEGEVSVDGIDLRDLNVQYARSVMSVVSQEPVLFDCTIAENIKYGLEDDLSITHAEVVEAAKQANIHTFVIGLPNGYETRVGERGTQLSGGQKQRVAIARALIRKPQILLLDEATSALDTDSEKVVQDALDVARQGRTCIIIAHRLSTIQTADTIGVIKDGHIIEMGTHAELVQRQGFYYTLTQKQFRDNGSDETADSN